MTAIASTVGRSAGVAFTSNSGMRLPIPKSSTLPRPSGITITLAPHDQLHRDE